MPVNLKVVKTGRAGLRTGSPIKNNLINSTDMGTAVGKKFIAENYFTIREHEFDSPYQLGMRPGKFIEVTSTRMELTNAEMRIQEMEIYQGNATVMCHVSAFQFLEPEVIA